MEWLAAPEYWLARQVLQRGVAAIYLIAFIGAARQFRALIGEHGMLPVQRFVARAVIRRRTQHLPLPLLRPILRRRLLVRSGAVCGQSSPA